MAVCLGASALAMLALGSSSCEDAGAVDESALPTSDASVARDVTADRAPRFDVTPSIDAGGAPLVLVVHASPDLPAATEPELRLCFEVDGRILPLRPLPDDGNVPEANYPGVPSGGGVTLPDLGDLAQKSVVLYALRARHPDVRDAVAVNPSARTCDSFVCDQITCLAEWTDYVRIPIVRGPSAESSDVQLFAIGGCLPKSLDPGATAARCGADYDPENGNPHANAYSLDSHVPAGEIGAQLVHLAPALVAARDGGGAPIKATHDFMKVDPGDAGILLGRPAFLELTAIAPLPVPSNLGGYFDAGIVISNDDSGPDLRLAMSLGLIQQITNPSVLPTEMYPKGNVLFALVGDPNDPVPQLFLPDGGGRNPKYDGQGLHLIVLPARSRSGGAGGGPIPP